MASIIQVSTEVRYKSYKGKCSWWRSTRKHKQIFKVLVLVKANLNSQIIKTVVCCKCIWLLINILDVR